GYLDYAKEMGFVGSTAAITMNLYSEELQRFRLSAQGHGDSKPPDTERRRIETYFDPLPFWYAPLEETHSKQDEYPLHAVTQRPMAMYHSWGSQNAWLRQIHGHNALFVHRETAAARGIEDGDWVWVKSRHRRIKVPVQLVDGVNPQTVWTWNAIGKRAGAWNLAKDASETKKGFLLNHLIDDLLPKEGNRPADSNSDPITGQAAWYDLRVEIEKAAPEETAIPEPQFPDIPLFSGLVKPANELRFGAKFRSAP
ncbi:MAG: molybdopterin oxidoreductase family protein, partial [Pseudomonadota bacterium]